MRKSRPGYPKLVPALEVRPLADVEARRAAVAGQLAGGAWRTAWEIAKATGLHPEVVRTILRSSCAASRALPGDQIKARGGRIEYASEGTPGADPALPRLRPGRWSHAFCGSCEAVEAFLEAPAECGTDLVCSSCGSVIATLYRRNPRRQPAGASQGGASMSDSQYDAANPNPPSQPGQPSTPTGPSTPPTPSTPSTPAPKPTGGDGSL